MFQAQLSVMDLPLERWRFALQLSQPLSIEHFGSALRGAFGHALKALACDCSGPHHAHCLYQQIFEPPAPANWPQRFHNCPPAYVITPPTASRQPRQQAEFEFTLLGPSLKHRGLLWQAWQKAVSTPFVQRKISARLIPSAACELSYPAQGTTQLQLHLTSPMLLKRKLQGRLGSQPLTPNQVQLGDLLLALHRRLSLTQQLYGVPQQLPPLLHWLQQAERLSMQAQLHEAHFARYSNRQEQSMPLYGLLGKICINGPLSDDLLCAFALGQWLHIGGKTALGLGGYRLVETPDSSVNDRKSMP